MAPNRFMTDVDFTKTQMAVYYVVFLLSVDSLNPVHVLCQAVPFLQQWHMATLSIILLVYVILSELKAVLYFGVRIFFHSILSIFFREVEVVGSENIPRFGPVIFSINHANQFVDALLVLSTCQHRLSYLMAEASFNRRIIGDLAWALDVVPVKRAQDDARKGKGKITMKQQIKTEEATTAEEAEESEVERKKPDLICVKGQNTSFLEDLAPGDKIRPPGTAFGFKVVNVIDDTELVVDGSGRPSEFVLPAETFVAWDFLKKVDTRIVFEKVLDRLASGGAVGIFPEGGSHDRTELLPLKVGIALIAYSAMEQGLSVPIVPVGLNYFRAHRWRGRAVVEYGRPITIDPSTLKDYQAGGQIRKQVCNSLLEDIELSMRSVIVSAPDYETLQIIHTARRLWQRKKGALETQEKQDLTRRFAEGYKQLLLKSNGNPPSEWKNLQDRINAYRYELKDLGLRDYQVPALSSEHIEEQIVIRSADKFLAVLRFTYQVLHLFVLLCFAAIPTLLINLPVGLLAGVYAEQRRKRALMRSKVKVKAYDVMLTEKVVFCIVMVPTLWLFYAFMLVYFSGLDTPTIMLIIFCFPLFAYMGIVVAEAGMVDWRDLRPYFQRLIPAARRRLKALPGTRKHLQDDLRSFIRKIGPGLGEIYFQESVDWKSIMENSLVANGSPSKENKKQQ